MDVFLKWMNEKRSDIKIQVNDSGKQIKRKICTWESKDPDFIVASTVFIWDYKTPLSLIVFTDIMKVITQTLQSYDYNYMWDTVYIYIYQFSSVAQSCPTLCDPMNRSTPRLPVHHHFPEFTQTHVHRVRDAIQPSHPLSSPSPPAPNPSQHQSLFQWVNSSHEVAKVLEFQL